MFGRRPRTAWVTGLTATTIAATVLTGVPANAVSGEAAKDGALPFTAKLDIGSGKRACSGALVDPQWVITAAGCFADNPGQDKVTAGKPKLATSVTIGRTDLSGKGGQVRTVTELVPRADRDLVMAKLSAPVDDIAPVTVAGTAPAKDETLRVAGYGRTKDEWVPNRLHSGGFSVDAVDGTTLAVTGQNGASVCKGDTGGPALRETKDGVELVAVSLASWQGGCFGSDETRTGAVETRVDDLHTWVQQIRLTAMYSHVTDVVTAADFNGDGRPDIAAVLDDNNLHVFYTGPDGKLEYGRELWKHDGSWGRKRAMAAGDFDGDGLTDIAAVNVDGSLDLYPGTKSGKLGSPRSMAKDGSWKTIPKFARYKADDSGRDGLVAIWDDGSLYAYTTAADGRLSGFKRQVWHNKTWSKKHLTTGDFNGDGREDIAAVSQTGGLGLYTGNAKGTFDYDKAMWPDESWGNFRAVLGGDFDGDGKADIAAINSSGGLFLYPGNGKGTLGSRSAMWPSAS
ncbi:FG-GAP-like repeat-containing protein [Streptomyces sp. NPDC059788]|uniref:FG-GAP-like repeat-containing protein n=1 Tax=Streptomyces sp. NPDC059788 TaxID=3346948 RepID=UPI00365F587B